MFVQHDVRTVPTADDVPAGGWFRGLRRTALLAIGALAGCGLLIAFGAAMSLCWMVHPGLSGLALIAITWLAARLAGRLVSTSGSAR